MLAARRALEEWPSPRSSLRGYRTRLIDRLAPLSISAAMLDLADIAVLRAVD